MQWNIMQLQEITKSCNLGAIWMELEGIMLNEDRKKGTDTEWSHPCVELKCTQQNSNKDLKSIQLEN